MTRNLDVSPSFDRFISAYPENWATPAGIDRARHLFEQIVQERLATEEQLIDAAEIYAIQRNGQSIDFTSAPLNWLRDGRWRVPRKSKVVRRHRSQARRWR